MTTILSIEARSVVRYLPVYPKPTTSPKRVRPSHAHFTAEAYNCYVITFSRLIICSAPENETFMKFAIPTVYNNNILLYFTYNMSRIWRREDDRQSFDVDGSCLNFLRESSSHRTRNHPPTMTTRFYRVFNTTAATIHDEACWGWWTHTHVYNAYYTVSMIYDFPATFVYEMFTPPPSVYMCVCVCVYGALYIFNSHLSACLSPSTPLPSSHTHTHRRRSNIFDDYAPFSLSTRRGSEPKVIDDDVFI